MHVSRPRFISPLSTRSHNTPPSPPASPAAAAAAAAAAATAKHLRALLQHTHEVTAHAAIKETGSGGSAVSLLVPANVSGGGVAGLSASLASGQSTATAAAPPSPVQVDFFFDIVSPYSWFAFETLLRYRDSWNLSLDLKPVFTGAMMARTGNQPPALSVAKAPYLAKDVQRLARYFELPMGRFPPTRMQDVLMGSISVQRLLVALKARYPPQVLEAVVGGFWTAHFARDEDIMAEESKRAILMQTGGLSAEQAADLLRAATTPEVKASLQSFTEEALSHGAFGVPTMVFPVATVAGGGGVDAPGERVMLFGSDRFHLMAALLNQNWNGPQPKKKKKIMSRL